MIGQKVIDEKRKEQTEKLMFPEEFHTPTGGSQLWKDAVLRVMQDSEKVFVENGLV